MCWLPFSSEKRSILRHEPQSTISSVTVDVRFSSLHFGQIMLHCAWKQKIVQGYFGTFYQ